MRVDSCSGFRFPVEPAPGPATSSVPCDPVVTRCGFLGQDAGLWSQCLSNHLPQGAVEKLNQLLKNKNKPAARCCEAVYGLRKLWTGQAARVGTRLQAWEVARVGSASCGGSRGETVLKKTLELGAGPSFPRRAATLEL